MYHSYKEAVIATVATAPSITGTTPGSRCDAGTVTLGATSGGTINWYDVPTGGTSLGSGPHLLHQVYQLLPHIM